MDGKEFFEQFQNEINERDETGQRKHWDCYSDNKTFTDVINRRVIPKIIENANLIPEQEYYRIDVTGYQKEEIQKMEDTKLNFYRWDLEIAVEHENNDADWLNELVKLLHVRCPLKVIISYNRYDNRDEGGQSDLNKLKCAAECMKATRCFAKSEDSSEEYLIILGNCGGKDHYASFDYRGYLYNYEEGSFEPIKD